MIAFASRTGNIRYVVGQLGLPNAEIQANSKLNEPFIIFTYTDKLGAVPEKTMQFLKNNYSLCRGVIASGNINFGTENFAAAADKISAKYNIPILHKIDLRGAPEDYEYIRRQYEVIKWK